jgi:hypothetical protein
VGNVEDPLNRVFVIASLRRLRRIVAPALLALYGLPAAAAMVADAVHAAQHVGAAAVAGHRRAVALGLVHTSLHATRDASSETTAADVDGPGVGGIVHTHGGTTHAHDARVAALLQATDAGSSESVDAPPPSVAPHVRAVRVAMSEPPTTDGSTLDLHLDAGVPPAFAPATPPPRA